MKKKKAWREVKGIHFQFQEIFKDKGKGKGSQ